MYQALADMPAAPLEIKPVKYTALVRLILGSPKSGMYCPYRQSDAHLDYPFDAMPALIVLTSASSAII